MEGSAVDICCLTNSLDHYILNEYRLFGENAWDSIRKELMWLYHLCGSKKSEGESSRTEAYKQQFVCFCFCFFSHLGKEHRIELPHMVQKYKWLFGFYFWYKWPSYVLFTFQTPPIILAMFRAHRIFQVFLPCTPLWVLQECGFGLLHQVKIHDQLKCFLKPEGIQTWKKVVIKTSYHHVISFRNKDCNCHKHFLLVLLCLCV